MLDLRDSAAFRKEVLEADEPTVTMFWATWCPFCRKFKPEFDRLATQKPWRFARVYLDDYENPLWDDYAVEVVPTLALFRSGRIEVREDGILGYGLDPKMVAAFVGRIDERLVGRNASQPR